MGGGEADINNTRIFIYPDSSKMDHKLSMVRLSDSTGPWINNWFYAKEHNFPVRLETTLLIRIEIRKVQPRHRERHAALTVNAPLQVC